MKNRKAMISVMTAALFVLLTCASCGMTKEQTKAGQSNAQASETVKALAEQQPVQVDDSDSIVITFNNSTATVSGAGADADGADVTIRTGGVYTVRGTTSDGRIVVDAGDEDVTLVLDNAQIACADSSAIYVVSANKATVYAAENTQNTLTDGKTYNYDDAYSSKTEEEPNACLYSKADLVLAGGGTLVVNGQSANGVTGKDTVRIESLTLTVNATNNGVTGKDSLTVKDASVTVTAQGDALRSTNDSDENLGYVVADNVIFDLTSGEDGISAQTYLSLSGTTVTVKAGGGSDAKISDDASAKGLKAGTDITIDDGSCTLDCADDTIHADGNVTVQSGTFKLTTGDDGVHAENAVTVNDGDLTITGHEGIEGTLITLNGGNISITASDDGINAAQKTSGVTPTVEINGGEIEIEMGQGDTDGIDSNGDIIINGGTIRVTGQSSFDYDGKGELNGGTVYVNGQQVTELSNQFGGMGGRMGGMTGQFGQTPDGGMPQRGRFQNGASGTQPEF